MRLSESAPQFSCTRLRWRRYIKVVGGFHLELVQSLTGAGNDRLIGILGVRHSDVSPFIVVVFFVVRVS